MCVPGWCVHGYWYRVVGVPGVMGYGDVVVVYGYCDHGPGVDHSEYSGVCSSDHSGYHGAAIEDHSGVHQCYSSDHSGVHQWLQ